MQRASRMSRVIRLYLLVVTVIAGVWFVITAPQHAGLRGDAENVLDSPLITIAEAQSHADFPIKVPPTLPGEANVKGARVIRVTVRNLDDVIARAKASQRPFTGYGVLFLPQGKRLMVRAHQASPAEKSGLPSDQLFQLISLDDEKITASNASAWSRIRKALNSPPPLKVTYADKDGTSRSVVIAQKESFMAGAEMPQIDQRNRIALIFSIRGREFTLLEGPSSKTEPTLPEARPIRVSGQPVWFMGSETKPSAYWRNGGTDFSLDNSHGALDRKEVYELIESMLKSRG